MADWNPHFFDLSPMFEPFSPLAEAIRMLRAWPECLELERLSRNTEHAVLTCSGLPVRFVPQGSVTDECFTQRYEPRIYLTGEVSTRSENWHDFFNALVWMTFPRAKAVLNHIHYDALVDAPQKETVKRGALRDAATLFDESGVIVLSSRNYLIELLRQHAWKAVFWEQRKTVLSSVRFIVFGHALYEKALNPYVGMTGKGIFFRVEDAFLQQPLAAQLQAIDLWVADFLRHQLTSNADLSAIPVLGYPGWSDANDTRDYYDNRQYFRPCPLRR